MQQSTRAGVDPTNARRPRFAVRTSVAKPAAAAATAEATVPMDSGSTTATAAIAEPMNLSTSPNAAVPTPTSAVPVPPTLDYAHIMTRMMGFLEREEQRFQQHQQQQQSSASPIQAPLGPAPVIAADIGDARGPIPVAQTSEGQQLDPSQKRVHVLRRDGVLRDEARQPVTENPKNHYDPEWIDIQVRRKAALMRNPWYNAASEIAGRMGMEPEDLLTGPIPHVHTAEDQVEENEERARAILAAANQALLQQPGAGGAVGPQPTPRGGVPGRPGYTPAPPKTHTPWLNQPENSGYIMYKASLKAAMSESLNEVRHLLQNPAVQLYDLITHEMVQDLFFNLVRINIRDAKVLAPTRNETPSILLPELARRKRAAWTAIKENVSVDPFTGKLMHRMEPLAGIGAAMGGGNDNNNIPLSRKRAAAAAPVAPLSGVTSWAEQAEDGWTRQQLQQDIVLRQQQRAQNLGPRGGGGSSDNSNAGSGDIVRPGAGGGAAAPPVSGLSGTPAFLPPPPRPRMGAARPLISDELLDPRPVYSQTPLATPPTPLLVQQGTIDYNHFDRMRDSASSNAVQHEMDRQKEFYEMMLLGRRGPPPYTRAPSSAHFK